MHILLAVFVCELDIVIPIYLAECIKIFGPSSLQPSSGLLHIILLVMIALFIISSVLLYSYEMPSITMDRRQNFIKELNEIYTRQREQHINNNHLTMWNILDKAFGKDRVYYKLIDKDINSKNSLQSILNQLIEKHSIDKEDIENIKSNIKYHKSIITDRASFLVIFAVALTTLLWVKDIDFLKKVIDTRSLQIICILIGMLGVLERQSIVKQSAVYDEIISALDESEKARAI